MRALAFVALLGWLVSACGAQYVDPTGDAVVGSDAIADGIAPPDGGPTDVMPPQDVISPPPDVPLPPPDGIVDEFPLPDVVPPPTDAIDIIPPPTDVPIFDILPPPTDVPIIDIVPPPADVVDIVPPPTDVPIIDSPPPVDVTDVPIIDASDVPLVDAPPPSLAGNWRLVEYDAHNADGTITVFRDTDTTIVRGGFSVQIRDNGMLFLATDRISENVGFLINDHFFVDNNQPNFTMAFSTFGFAAPGTLSGNTFTVSGGSASITFTPNADGTISQTDATSGNVATWARITSALGTTTYFGQGQATLWMPASSAPFTSARVTLAWDAPGLTTIYTNDQPIAFGPFNNALYDLSVNAPPTGAITGIAGTEVALAYVVIYDDVNRNASFDFGTDTIRGVSPVALAWRGGPSSVPFQTSVYRNLDFGFQVVHLQPDYGSVTNTPAPYDPTHPVTPDAPVNTGPSPTPIPNML